MVAEIFDVVWADEEWKVIAVENFCECLTGLTQGLFEEADLVPIDHGSQMVKDRSDPEPRRKSGSRGLLTNGNVEPSVI